MKYSGRLCILSMATAVSLCVVGSKDANATVGGGALFSLTRMFRGIGDSVNSGVVGVKKIISSKTSSGLKIGVFLLDHLLLVQDIRLFH